MKNDKYFDLMRIMPHREPLALIDKVIEYDLTDLSLKASFAVTDRSLFFDQAKNGVPCYFGLEYMAQATATLSGINDREKKAGENKFGFIIGCRNYQSRIENFAAGSEYIVHVKEIFLGEELGSFSCRIEDSSGNLCAEGEVNVFTPADPDKFKE